MHLTSFQVITLCVCVACMTESIHVNAPLNASVFSYRSFAPQQPAALSPPPISNTVFCPSSLLAYAGAHKVVIFFKVRMFGCTPVKLSKQAPASSSGGNIFACGFLTGGGCIGNVLCVTASSPFATGRIADYFLRRQSPMHIVATLECLAPLQPVTELQCQANVTCWLNGNS